MTRPIRAGKAMLLGATLAGILVLPGCILQTDTPLISEAKAQLLLGQGAAGSGVKVDLFQSDTDHPGQWKPFDQPHLTLTVKDHHYIVPDPDDPASPEKIFPLWLMPLDSTHVAIQIGDPAGILYGLGTWDGRTLDMDMLGCADLQRQAASARWVVFDGDDCHPKPGQTDPVALLQKLVPLMAGPGLRVSLAR